MKKRALIITVGTGTRSDDCGGMTATAIDGKKARKKIDSNPLTRYNHGVIKRSDAYALIYGSVLL